MEAMRATIVCSFLTAVSDSGLSCLQEHQTGTQMATEACGFTTIVIGTFLLHATRELDVSLGEHSLPRLKKFLPTAGHPMPVLLGSVRSSPAGPASRKHDLSLAADSRLLLESQPRGVGGASGAVK
jgi:hypothetical protein